MKFYFVTRDFDTNIISRDNNSMIKSTPTNSLQSIEKKYTFKHKTVAHVQGVENEKKVKPAFSKTNWMHSDGDVPNIENLIDEEEAINKVYFDKMQLKY